MVMEIPLVFNVIFWIMAVLLGTLALSFIGWLIAQIFDWF